MEAKTYTLGARIPQLDKYDTEESDIQILVDEELEKTLEEDSTSEAKSEEELKEPGLSIDQQICLTLIAQSLKASPTDTKQPINPFLIIEAIMMTHTATQASMAITSSQPAHSSSSSNSTTPQQLCEQLQQILRRHSGGPSGPGGPGGPRQPNPAIPQQPILPATDVKTMGALPQVFYGDRTKADHFIDKVKGYLYLNTDVVGYNSPFKKVDFTLTFVKGESTAQWAREMGDWFNRLVLPPETTSPTCRISS